MVTKRQKQILDYLKAYIERHDYAPTLEEIRRHFGLGSLATVHKHLQGLERKGFIRRLTHQSRALELADPGEGGGGRSAVVPLLGRVAAGTPIEPIEDPERIAIPEEMLGRRRTFALRVRGDSMVNDGILNDDIVLVEERDTADTGATVVALVKGEATVKKFRRLSNGRIRLEPANDRMSPITAREEDVRIRGVVIALLRRYR
jgi:repressor LexA